jgi:hypothetical protein
LARKGYSCSHAGQEEGGAGHHDGQLPHTPRPGAEDGGGGVKGVSRDVDQLMLYRLVNVPRILNLFMVTKDRQRMAAVTSAVQQFDPVSQFWVGELVVTADLVLFILRSILTVRFGY